LKESEPKHSTNSCTLWSLNPYLRKGLQKQFEHQKRLFAQIMAILEPAKVKLQVLRKGRVAMRVIAIAFWFICTQAATAVAQESRSDLFSQQPGRYQILMNPQLVRNTFLLDTATGRVWQLTTFTDVNDTPSVWTIMPRVDNDMEISQLVRERGLKPKEPSLSPPPAPAVKPQGPMRLNSN
jgi:hypothetical protein